MPSFQIEMDSSNANVYRLMGNNENALSFALGHLMMIDSTFMLDFLKEADILPRVPGKSYREYTNAYTISLQEQSAIGPSGRRDIVIESGGLKDLRVVIEAKIGRGTPDSCQLLRYSVGCNCGRHSEENPEKINQMWGERQHKYIVSLTRDTLSSQVCADVSRKLSGSGIKLRTLQWSNILELALQRLRQKSIEVHQVIFLQEFVNFFKEHYEMHTYQVEVMVKKDDFLNAEKVYLNGYMYVGGSKDIQVPLYFAPYFTTECIGKLPGIKQAGICYISRVFAVVPCNVKHFSENPEAIADTKIRSNILWAHWRKGLAAIADRIEHEHWENDRMQLYFLSEPAKLNRTVKGPMQIPPGYGTTIYDLLTKDDLRKH